MPYIDLVLEDGRFAADWPSFDVKITNGTLNLRCVATTGRSLVTAVRSPGDRLCPADSVATACGPLATGERAGHMITRQARVSG
ncbi:hypothetical protein AB0M68_36845 [Streptomyces sp. NPDC051453]|uniref:hypothetical protein n=1 Tax=Streptomyces sp. NPDC051453 TaxID=3154941 RepID=UPI00341DAD50